MSFVVKMPLDVFTQAKKTEVQPCKITRKLSNTKKSVSYNIEPLGMG